MQQTPKPLAQEPAEVPPFVEHSVLQQIIILSYHKPETWDRCYDFLNIFAEKFCEKIGVFNSKQS
jgi:hypothetical protein